MLRVNTTNRQELLKRITFHSKSLVFKTVSAIFKHNGTYWMITSGCTGWAPNEARMFSAPSIWGPWTQHPNPCRGPLANKTFNGQSTFVLPVNGQNIFMADIWRPQHPRDARYIWLPIEFEDGKPVINWQDEWQLK